MSDKYFKGAVRVVDMNGTTFEVTKDASASELQSALKRANDILYEMKRAAEEKGGATQSTWKACADAIDMARSKAINLSALRL